MSDSEITDSLLRSVRSGDKNARDELLQRHRPYLRHLVDVRLEPALSGRVDASDIVQDALVVASRRLDEFIEQRPISFRVWLRRNAMDRLVDARRRHLAQRRDARREIMVSDASSLAIAKTLAQRPGGDALRRKELAGQVREAISHLSEVDCEIVMLRHAEGLTNQEASEVIGIDSGAASKRYGRALARLATELRKLGVHTL